MKAIDRILGAFGLVRKSRHETIVSGHRSFCRALGTAAKEKGVQVVIDDERLIGVEMDTDVFVLGCRNVIGECDFIGTGVFAAPACGENLMYNNRFFPRTPA